MPAVKLLAKHLETRFIAFVHHIIADDEGVLRHV